MSQRFQRQITAIVFIAWLGAEPLRSQDSPTSAGQKSSPVEVSQVRPYLGLRAASAGETAARQLGIESPSGVVVLSTVVAGPSDASGLRRGDLIVEFAGRDITNVDDLAKALAACPIGSSQTVIYVRGTTRQESRIVIGGRLPEKGAAPQPASSPTSSPIASGPTSPPSSAEPQLPVPPAGWVEREVGNLIVYLPPDWKTVPFLASDEGCWFRGTSAAKQAVFAVIRDTSKEELLGPMQVEREEPLSLAGRAAVGYFGLTVEQKTSGQGLVVYPVEREADRSRLAVLCFASGERWSEFEPTFRTILRCLRNRAAAP